MRCTVTYDSYCIVCHASIGSKEWLGTAPRSIDEQPSVHRRGEQQHFLAFFVCNGRYHNRHSLLQACKEPIAWVMCSREDLFTAVCVGTTLQARWVRHAAHSLTLASGTPVMLIMCMFMPPWPTTWQTFPRITTCKGSQGFKLAPCPLAKP